MRDCYRTLALVATIALPAAGLAQQRQTDAGFTWSGKIPAGRWIRIRNLNGPITVAQASGDNVEVTATKHWRRGDPAVVHFDTKKSSDESVTICALWGDRATCDDRGDESRNDRRTNNNDVSVEFRVLVPKGVKVAVNTVNGAVTVDGATSDVDAHTINGELQVNTSGGRVNATNVNGGVRVRMGRLDNDGNMEFTTVNGSVSVEFAGDSGADLDLQTVTGSLNTNFEMTLSGRLDPHHLRTHVGRAGGPRIRLETVNGDVEIRKR